MSGNGAMIGTEIIQALQRQTQQAHPALRIALCEEVLGVNIMWIGVGSPIAPVIPLIQAIQVRGFDFHERMG